KGFTLVELLVVIAIIALLMGILMPALARVRQIAYRMVSGTNQSGIGKAMMIYANDNDGDYPVSGSRRPLWSSDGQLPQWDDQDRKIAYGYTLPTDETDDMTITSCLYLLVKYADVATKQFVNKADVGVLEFSLSEDPPTDPDMDLTDVWDFGGTDVFPGKYCSYSYHFPFYGTFSAADKQHYPVTQQSNPSKPVLADRNPYCVTSADADTAPHGAPDSELVDPDWDTAETMFVDKDGKANATAHQQNGQNVLFNDIHVKFEKLSNCGINDDNIYIPWSDIKANMDAESINGFDARGWPSIEGKSYDQYMGMADLAPNDEYDSVLVSEIMQIK
ncbi:MAG: type II secretion system protein, partial [Planctomycetes bacterium]|nr:type II secretion system protein [Planctomycetota bacterium]